MSLIASGQDR